MHNDSGALFRILFFVSSSGSMGIYSSRKERIFLKSPNIEYQIKTLRWTIVALIFSIVWLAFNPIWFPQAKLEYDFMRIFLLFTALLATFTAYLTYKRKLNRR